ncbi:MAG: type II toxin-antitoxin system HicB family antitoxin [Anaerolineae bacterium]|nr:type II toxin-antitoxin system HicB family antitoxin [Anaerolineae bacterium]
MEYFDGQEEGDLGHPYYVASCAEITASTDGSSLDEVVQNIREVIKLYLEVNDPEKDLNLVAHPRIIVTIEYPESYAETA